MSNPGFLKMIGVITRVTEWWIRVVVVFSLGGHVVLALLAGIRRREGPGVGMGFLWLAYQVVDQAAPFFLSNLSLGSTLREQQLVELWVPSIVAHLAGPDNITAYSLEDNKLSIRVIFSAALQIIKIFWLMYKQFKIVTSRGPLFWASVVMVFVGVWKYGEKVVAFWKAKFGNIGSSSKKKKKPMRLQFLQGLAALGRFSEEEEEEEGLLSDEQALLLAHQLLDITKAAFADKFYLGKKEVEQLKQDTNLQVVFNVYKSPNAWRNMRKVVEMELSLMYDILYTKAAVIHNWSGFVIRVVSPVVTATVMVLFVLTGSTDGERTADVIITYVLLGVTLLLDVRWLLGAAASTWTYTFFNSIPCLRHEVCCSGRWHRLRRFVESLNPWQLLPLLRMHGADYRLWSGTMGQYNLFQERTQLDQGGTTVRLLSSLAKTLKFEDIWMEYRYSSRLKLDERSDNNVKVLLFEQLQKAFKMEKPPIRLAMPTPSPPAMAHQRRRDLDEELDFLPEFQELILIWHVATHVFLEPSNGQFTGYVDHMRRKYEQAIRAVSHYMAFLAAVRPDMLPGLKLSSLHQATRESLERLSKDARMDGEPLIDILRKKENEKVGPKNSWERRTALYEESIILSDGVKFANLLFEKVKQEDRPEGSKSNSRILFPEFELVAELLQENLPPAFLSKPEKPEDALPEGSNPRKTFQFLIPDFELEAELLLEKQVWPLPLDVWKQKREQYMAWKEELEESKAWKEKLKKVLGEGTNSRKRFEFLIPDFELKSNAGRLYMEKLLELLLKSWVRLLIYVSVRCSRDSHAKQLGRGCELTTIVWILSEHAGIFAPEQDDGRY